MKSLKEKLEDAGKNMRKGDWKQDLGNSKSFEAGQKKRMAKKMSVHHSEGTRFTKEKGELHGKPFVKLTGKTLSKETTGMTAENKSIARHNHRERQKSGEAGTRGYRPYRRD